MSGDDRQRQCALCERTVYDVAKMTSSELEDLLRRSRTRHPCLRLHRRWDGTLITGDCPTGARTRRRHAVLVGTTFAIVLTAAVIATALAAKRENRTMVMGDVLAPQYDLPD